MAEFKPNPGSFLPFLEAPEPKGPTPQSAPQSPLTLLEILARQGQSSLPIFDLQTLSRMDPSSYAAALKNLRDAGYIAITGDAPEQIVQLSDAGAGVVQLTRPA